MDDVEYSITDRLQHFGISESELDAPSVGATVSRRWQAETGEPAKFIDRPKTRGGVGTHKMGVYPAWFVPVIDAIIQEALTKSRSEQRRRAPKPADVEKALAARRGVPDVTPQDGADYWWGSILPPRKPEGDAS